MRVALIHDWLTGMRGGEKCLEIFCELFSEATLFTLLHKRGSLAPAIESMNIRTSFVRRFPKAETWYRNYLPFFPAAIEDFDLREFDLVLSSSHCVAKGIIPAPKALHICYCHTPMRYMWDAYQHYFGPEQVGALAHLVLPYFANYLRMWDAASSQRVDYFIANSKHVQRRIWRYYRREAEVIHPPVDTAQFSLAETHEGYFLIVSALVPYKRIDLAVAAFNRLDEKLIIIGDGPRLKALQKLANKNIEFIGWQNQAELVRHYKRCRALVFPGEEDFGIVPLEAQACGKPVIAYAAGGALETVKGSDSEDGICTGVFFSQPTPESLIDAVQRLNLLKFEAQKIRAHALQFDREIFKDKIKRFIAEKYEKHQTSR
jgi:glycosyltransferase involved in cell wall biosynthesis